MYKKSLLLLFVFLLSLTSCADDSQPTDSKNTEKETYHNNTPDTTVDDPPDVPNAPDDPEQDKETDPNETDPSETEPSEEEATKDPKEVLNKVLNDLDELDKLFNGE